MSYFSDPVRHYETVTPSDTTKFAVTSHGIYIGVTGDIAVEDKDGQSTVFANVPAGVILPIRVRKVLSTGTTASSIVRLW